MDVSTPTFRFKSYSLAKQVNVYSNYIYVCNYSVMSITIKIFSLNEWEHYYRNVHER